MPSRRIAARPSFVQSLEPRRLLAAVSWDGGGDGTTWTSTANWSTDALPTSADDVTINVAANPTIRLNGANAVINSLTSAEALNLDSGTLSVATASTTSAAVTLAGATLSGAGLLTLGGGLTWTSGRMIGTGKTVLASASTSTISTTDFKFLGRTLDNAGVVNYSGTQLYLGTSGSGGTVNNLAGATFTVTNDGDLELGSTGTTNVFNNAGTFAKTTTPGLTQFSSVAFNNTGTVQLAVGTLQFNAGGSNSGTFDVAGGATLSVPNLTYQTGTSFTGAGSLAFDGNTTFNVDVSVGLPSTFAGSLAGSGTVTFSGGLTWTSGNMTGVGKTAIASGATATIAGPDLKFLGRTLDNAGTVTYSGTQFYLGTSGSGGTINNLAGATFTVTNDGDLQFGSSGTINAFNNAGTFSKTTTAGLTQFSSVAFNNTGTVRLVAGTLQFGAGGSNSGTFDVAGGATLSVPNLTYAAGTAFTGAGTLAFDGSTTFNVNVSVGLPSVFSGTLTGTGTVTFSGGLTWTSGSMTGTGKTVLAAGSANAVTTTDIKFLGRTLENSGTVTYSGTQLYLGTSGSNGTFNNLAGATFTVTNDGDVQIGSTGTTNVFNNAGTFAKTTTPGLTQFSSVAFNNTGTTQLAAGTLQFSAGGSNSGTFDVAAGATLSVPNLTYQTGTNFTGAGTLAFDGSTTFNVNVAVGLPATLSGSLAGSGTLTFSGGLTWSSGTMSGTGKTVLAAGSSNTITTTDLKFLGRTLENAGTVTYSGTQLYLGTSGSNGTVNNLAGATFTVTNDGDLQLGTTGTTNVFNNAGTFAKTTTSGLTQFNPVAFNNTGTVQLAAGTLAFTSTNVGTGIFLSSGRYFVASGTTLDFGPAVTTLTADIEIAGTGSVPDLAGLRTNRGRLALTTGANLTLSAGDYMQEGILDLGSGSTFTVNGNFGFAGVSQPVIRSEIFSALSFGRVVVSGVVNLESPSSTSRFDPDLIGGYDPPLGTTFAIINGNSGVNTFDSYQGDLTPSGNVLAAWRPNGQIYGAQIIPGPLPPPPQIVSQTFDYLTRQAVMFQFNQDVSAFLSRKDFTLVNQTTGQTVANNVGTLSYNQASNQATLLLTNLLADGDYKLTVNASDIANAAGVPASGSPIVLDFFVLAGDLNRDRKVTIADFNTFAINFGKPTGQTNAMGDLNYDGAVNIADFNLFATNFGKLL